MSDNKEDKRDLILATAHEILEEVCVMSERLSDTNDRIDEMQDDMNGLIKDISRMKKILKEVYRIIV